MNGVCILVQQLLSKNFKLRELIVKVTSLRLNREIHGWKRWDEGQHMNYKTVGRTAKRTKTGVLGKQTP